MAQHHPPLVKAREENQAKRMSTSLYQGAHHPPHHPSPTTHCHHHHTTTTTTTTTKLISTSLYQGAHHPPQHPSPTTHYHHHHHQVDVDIIVPANRSPGARRPATTPRIRAAIVGDSASTQWTPTSLSTPSVAVFRDRRWPPPSASRRYPSSGYRTRRDSMSATLIPARM